MNYGDVEIVSKAICFQGFFRIEKYRLRHALFAGGMSEEMSRELFERGHAVAMLPYDPQLDKVVLIEQFRIGALNDASGPWMTEIVAGMIGDAETAEEVAQRESLEESGCPVTALQHICSYYPSPGACSETIELFCGRVDASKAGGIHGLDHEHEDIRVFTVDFNEAFSWIDSGRLNSAAVIMALQWLAMNKSTLLQSWKD
jgi:ADP-ribose pyrophosphatase